MNVLPLPQALRSEFLPEKESTRGRQSIVEVKGKEKEVQLPIVEDEAETPNKVWLGTDMPYKGPNKWFGGSRLRGCESSASQVASGSTKMNQNILFGIATPQLPVWAADPLYDSKSPKLVQCQSLKQWPEHEEPPHLTHMSSAQRRITRRNQNDNPLDDEGD